MKKIIIYIGALIVVIVVGYFGYRYYTLYRLGSEMKESYEQGATASKEEIASSVYVSDTSEQNPFGKRVPLDQLPDLVAQKVKFNPLLPHDLPAGLAWGDVRVDTQKPEVLFTIGEKEEQADKMLDITLDKPSAMIFESPVPASTWSSLDRAVGIKKVSVDGVAFTGAQILASDKKTVMGNKVFFKKNGLYVSVLVTGSSSRFFTVDMLLQIAQKIY